MSDPKFECRACLGNLKPNVTYLDIFESRIETAVGLITTVAVEMGKLANIEIPDIKGYPRHICTKCLGRLKVAIPFVKNVQTSEETLKNRPQCLDDNEYEEGTSEKIWPKPIELDKNVNGEVLRKSTDVDIKQEVISDEELEDTVMNDDDREDDLNMDIKVEPDEITEHPAIQVTVNDSLAGKQIEIELEGPEDDPLKNDSRKRTKPSYNNSNVKRTKKIKTVQDFDKQDSKYVEGIDKLNTTQLRISLNSNDDTGQSTIDKPPSNRTTKKVAVRIVGPPCNCKNDCRSKLTEEQRQNICNYYHSENPVNQRAFIINFTSKEHVRRHRKTQGKRDRNFTYKYDLPLDITSGDLKTADKVRVCREMFVNTILSKVHAQRVWKGHKVDNLPAQQNKTTYNTRKQKYVQKDNKVTLVTSDTFPTQQKYIQNKTKYKKKHKHVQKDDKVTSVCEHFKILQIDKLTQLKERTYGSQGKPIKKLSFNKMYNLYRNWIQSTNYTRTVKSYRTYKYVILKNIPQHQIETLQGNSSSISKNRKKAPTVNKTLDNINIEKDHEVSLDLVKDENGDDEFTYEYLESDEDPVSQANKMIDTMKEEIPLDGLISSMTERSQSTFEKECNDIDDSEKLSISEKQFKDDDNSDSPSDLESVCSNFSDELEEEVKEEQNKRLEKKTSTKQKIKRKSWWDEAEKGNSSDDVSEESTDDDLNIENIKKEAKPKMCTRNSGVPDAEKEDLLKQLDMTKDIVRNAEKEDEQLLTAKLRRPTRDPMVIRQYCKYRGLAYVTNSGRIVPKKVLGPPCACIKKCFTKISQEHRQFIFDYFWSLGSKEKLMSFIRDYTARVLTQKIFPNRRSKEFRLQYFLPTTTKIDTDAVKEKVCMKMFYNTLVCSSRLASIVWQQDKNSKQENSSQQEEITKEGAEGRSAIGSVNKKPRRKPEHDHTTIDFVYRAMPFEEYMAHFGLDKKGNTDGSFADGIPKKIKDKKTIKKIKKGLGKRYINSSGKIVAEKSLGPACNCRIHCSNRITENQRRFLFQYYWALGSRVKQRAFVVRFTTRGDAKFHYRFSKKRREYVYRYYLPVTEDFDGEKVQVCSVMFNNTFAISHAMCPLSWNKYEEGQFTNKSKSMTTRPRVVKKEKIDSIKFLSALDHFNYLREKYPKMEAFKLYLNTKQYPDGMYSPGKLYKHYTEWFEPTKYSRKIETFGQYEYSWAKVRERLSIAY